MLLFIRVSQTGRKYRIRFNTSHVTLYPCHGLLRRDLWKRYNTSHVTLYLMSGKARLLLIRFQYISCYSLSRMPLLFCCCCTGVSIHLMLLFIGDYRSGFYQYMKFQYISCYSLSVLMERYSSNRTGFNTSHVTLYPGIHTSLAVKDLFQYISCYSLSLGQTASKSIGVSFQYISCYSLSWIFTKKK